MNLLRRLPHLGALKNKIRTWLGIVTNADLNEFKEEVKDKILFELSFLDRFEIKEQDNSKLFFCQYTFFLKKESAANNVFRFYRARSKSEAYGVFVNDLKDIDITPETVSCKWCPKVIEITTDTFIDVREDA